MVYSPVNPWTFPVNPSFPWLPAANTITAITNANPAVITTGTNHGYSDGLIIRIFFPFPYAYLFGMTQIDGLSGTITVLSANTFSVNINTINFDPFVISTSLESAQVLPIGVLANASTSDDFTQVNPVNPTNVADVPVFTKPGLQFGGPASQN